MSLKLYLIRFIALLAGPVVDDYIGSAARGTRLEPDAFQAIIGVEGAESVDPGIGSGVVDIDPGP
jgi:hypothetical protein